MMTRLAGNYMPWKAYLKIIRPINLLIMAGMLVLVRYAIFVPVFKQNHLLGLMPGWQFLLLVAATLFIGAGGYVINDVLDIEIDKINKPGKQIIGRQISEVKGNQLHVNLTAAGVVFGIAFSYFSGNIFLGILFVIIPTALFYYSYKYKYIPAVGNLVVSVLAALVVFIYWLFEFYHLKSQPELFIEDSRSFPLLNRLVLAFAFFAFMTTLIREIAKDIQDIEGDKRFGCRTLPVVLGIRATRYILIFLEIVTVIALVRFHMILYHSYYTLFSEILLVVVLLMIISIYLTIRAHDKPGFSRVSIYMKLVMIAGMLTLISTWFRNLT
jgi:4-hydroxybenzoate polyprenyltransferase